MGNWTEKDVENLIRDSVFPNPGHKRELRRQLLETTVELDLGDLDAVAGGVAQPEPEDWANWPTSGVYPT